MMLSSAVAVTTPLRRALHPTEMQPSNLHVEVFSLLCTHAMQGGPLPSVHGARQAFLPQLANKKLLQTWMIFSSGALCVHSLYLHDSFPFPALLARQATEAPWASSDTDTESVSCR